MGFEPILTVLKTVVITIKLLLFLKFLEKKKKTMTFINFDAPFFLLFLIFFFLTVFSSLIFISYLGLYGVFFLNLLSLS